MIYAAAAKRRSNWQHVLFMAMVINGALSALFDLIGSTPALFGDEISARDMQVIFVANMLYYSVHAMVPAIYARYIMHVFSLTANANLFWRFRFFFVLIVTEIVVFLNPFNQRLFTVDPSGEIRRGPMVALLYAEGVFYLLIALYTMLVFRKALRLRMLHAVAVYYFVVVIGSAIQLFYPALRSELFFQAIAFLGLFLTFEDDDTRYDEITGLYNKTAFRWDNIRLLNTKRNYYVINLKIRNLKFYARIMNTEGYMRLLQSIAEWMSRLRRGSDVYHFDDNYTMIIYKSTEEEIRQLIDIMKEMLEKAWYFDELEAHFRAFISVAKCPEDMKSVDSVFDLVEYETGSESEHVIIQYRESLAQVKREAAVERALRKAILNRSFQIYYQPIHNCETDRVCSAEALVRLFDDELGQVPPAEFIPIAEKSAMIVEIGDIIFEKVCRFIRDFHPTLAGIEYIEINISMAQFMFTGLVDRFDELIRTYGVKAGNINLEITESVASDSSESFMRAVRRLAGMGFTFSMDDYGTGYSNISSILNVEFKNIKMDKIFLTRALSDEASATVLKDTVKLIRHLNRNVLQEGVETREELSLVRESGCNLVQGFFFSQPLPEADFMEYIRSFNHVAAV